MTTERLRSKMLERRERGWTLKRLAQHYNVPLSTVWGFLRGGGLHTSTLDKMTAKKSHP